jgi:uncharacterized protein (DUF427 family)
MRYIIQERASGGVIASGTEEQVQEFEGHWYFAPDAVDMSHLRVTERTYTCPYKGVCQWVDLESPHGRARNIGWVYLNPKPGYEFIRGQFGFYEHDTAGTVSLRADYARQT